MPGPGWNGFEADAKGSELFQSATTLRDLGPGIRRDEQREESSATASYGHFTSGGIELRIDSTLPPVFSPNIVPRS
jgi:hypothetical protein